VVHIPNTVFFSSTSKNLKNAIFWVKIFIADHQEANFYAHIKYQVMFHIFSFVFAGFADWFVIFFEEEARASVC